MTSDRLEGPVSLLLVKDSRVLLGSRRRPFEPTVAKERREAQKEANL